MISTPAPGQTAEPQLQYLASLQGFKVQFTDFPKDGGNILRFSNFLLIYILWSIWKLLFIFSLVSIDTSPPLVAHGQGATVVIAHEEASTQAMQLLMTRGLEK